MQKQYQSIKKNILKLGDFIASRELLLSISVTLVMIVIGLTLGYSNNQVVPKNSDISARYHLEPSSPLSFMSNWDGPQYIQIAKLGYINKDVTEFFPLYPMLIHSLNKIISSPLYCALIVSWICLVGAIYFYIKIIKLLYRTHDNLDALRGVLFFLLFPSAVVLLATYTESLFAFLSLAALYFALRKKWLPAALLTMFATATHINGLFILVLIAMVLVEQKEKISNVVLAVIISSLGLVSYMWFLWVYFKDPLQFITGQKANGWLHSGYLHHLAATFSMLDLLGLIPVVLAVIYWWNRRKSFAIYSLLYLCIPLIGGRFSGFDRYALMAFPFQLMLYAKLKNHQFVYTSSVVFLGILWCYFLLQYTGGYSGSGG